MEASWVALFPGAWGPGWAASGPWVAFPLEGSEAGFLVAPSLENTQIHFYKKIQIQYVNDRGYNQRAAKTEKVVTLQQVEAFQTPTYKGWGDS